MGTAEPTWRVFWVLIAFVMLSMPSMLSSTTIAQTQQPPAQAPQSTPQAPEPAPAPKPQPTNKFVLRGCLNGSNLTAIEPTTPTLKLPEKLRVASTRVIRDQVKALSGHQVEVTGALFGVPGVEEGILIGDSGAAKVYVGGGDPNLGQDLVVNRNDPPTIRATMIKDVAPACTAKNPANK